ncbi:MAG: nitrilase-related carbon-nitrogen hydrolase [Terriglobia bacterium]
MEINFNRRHFLRSVALSGGAPLILAQKIALPSENSLPPQEKSNPLAPGANRNPDTSARELTVAGLQLIASKDVKANEQSIHRAIDKAAALKVDFLLTPEGSLSGYYPDFDRLVVQAAVQRLAQNAKERGVGLLLGTCYKELEEDTPSLLVGPNSKPSEPREYCYDQIRVYAPNGEFLGAYSKILLCSSIYRPGTGEMRDYVAGTLRTFQWEGICFWNADLQ